MICLQYVSCKRIILEECLPINSWAREFFLMCHCNFINTQADNLCWSWTSRSKKETKRGIKRNFQEDIKFFEFIVTILNLEQDIFIFSEEIWKGIDTEFFSSEDLGQLLSFCNLGWRRSVEEGVLRNIGNTKNWFKFGIVFWMAGVANRLAKDLYLIT